MRIDARSRGILDLAVRALLPGAVTLAVGSSALAGEGKWTLELEPMYMEAYGHDRHVMTIHEVDFDGTPQLDNKTVATLDTDSGPAFRVAFQYGRGQWGWGADLFWFLTSQVAESRTAAAEGPSGTIDEVTFEIADQAFTSSDPSEILFYDLLDDTDLEVWTLDLYGMRALVDRPESGIHLQFGLRLGDFDNDYFAVAGIQDVGGTHLGASSNYDRMMGPLVGLAGDVHLGKSYIRGSISQSVLIGSASLTSMSNEFTGPFSAPSFFDQETFSTEQDVAIPITEFRIKWTYSIGKHVSVGAGANASTWWDVPVPPGITPIEGGREALNEDTLVFLGLLGAVEITF